jgi:hypothetical protein
LKFQENVRDRLIGLRLSRLIYPGIVGYNPVTWQYSGLALKILNSLLLFILIQTLTGSTAAGVMGSLFYASFVGGLEAYSWSRIIAIEITFLLLTATAYVKSYLKDSYRLFVLAIVLATLSLSLELWRTFAILLIIPLWEFLNIFAKKHTLSVNKSLLRIGLFVLINFFILRFVLVETGNNGGQTSMVASYARILSGTIRSGNLKNLTNSLGNLIRSPLFPVNEQGGLTAGDALSQPIGILFLGGYLILIVYFIIKRRSSAISLLIFSTWIILFYFPNWLYESTLSVGASHRYLAISAVGFAIVIILIVNKIKMPYRIAVFLILLILALRVSEKIVDNDYKIRGTEVVKPLLDKMIHSITPGEKQSVIYIWGDNALRGYVFDWSGPYLYTYLRGIASFDDFPVFANADQAASLMCDPGTITVDWSTGNLKQMGKILSLDKVHGLYINPDGIMEDRTDTFKLDVASRASCLAKKQNAVISSGLLIRSTILVNNLDGKNDGKVGLIINWERQGGITNDNFSYVFYLIDNASSKVLDAKGGVVNFTNNGNKVTTSHVFDTSAVTDNKKILNYNLYVNVCSKNCELNNMFRNSLKLAL